MRLDKFLKDLALTELSATSAVDDDLVSFHSDGLLKVLAYLNEGLTELYTKFILSQKELIVERKTPFVEYYLRPEFARSNPSLVPYKYIHDTSNNKFDGGLIKILRVQNGYGHELYLNDYEQPRSLFTPTFDCLQITDVHEEDYFFVIYQADHNKLTVDDLIHQYIVLPDFLQPAIKSYVAGKYLKNMLGQNNTALGLQHLADYEKKCQEVMDKDLIRRSIVTTNRKLDTRGFV